MRSSVERFLVACLLLQAGAAGCSGESSGGNTGGEAGSAGGSPAGGTGGSAAEPGAGAVAGDDSAVGGLSGEAGDGQGGEAGDGSGATTGTGRFTWEVPAGFPVPLVPSDNRMTNQKVELGRHLFYDERLSANGTQSCASCHRQELAFTDGETTAIGSTGDAHPRNSMSLANVGYSSTLTWGNPVLFDLEDQALVPMFGTEPVELGLNGMEAELLERLAAVPEYQQLFEAAYPGDDERFTLLNVVRALAAFQRTLISGNSPYDRFVSGGDADALSESAKRGLEMFGTEKFECFHCHAGFALQDSVRFVGKTITESLFHNTGLYNIDGNGAYPAPNTGIHEVTRSPSDMGRFRVATLRNIAVTAPYMHDGSIATLSEVLDHYAAGGRTITEGPHAGVGSASPLRSSFMVGFEMTEEERADLLAFLESLTDDEFLTNPRFSNPWPQ